MNNIVKKKILVLGFYDRDNLGDECYKIAFTKIFGNYTLIFSCTDDVIFIPHDINTIIVGGGDIINSYFMSKVLLLLKDFKGNVYAFSVGIPYTNDGLQFLNIFDHVYLRSFKDYEIARSHIGSRNVTFLPDASVVFTTSNNPSPNNTPKKVGICLAQPLFYNNPNAHQILNNLCSVLSNFNYEYHLLAFNDSNSPRESDLVLNEKVYYMLQSKNVSVVNHTEKFSAYDMLQFFDQMDFLICMRYHSVMYSLIKQKQYIPLYVSSKIDKLLFDYPNKYVYKLPVNDTDQPTSLDENKLFNLIQGIINDPQPTPTLVVPHYFKSVNLLKKKEIMMKTNIDSLECTLLKCKKQLSRYFNITISDYDKLIHKRGKCCILHHDHINVARLVTFIITGNIQNPYVWGLSENMLKDDFCFFDALYYIWKDSSIMVTDFVPEQYYPVVTIEREIFVDIDYIFQNNFASYHRSGWAYALGGLMNINCSQLQRKSDLLLDTYVDRSFHWGLDTLCEVGILPYTKQWAGIIHHTYDTTHSTYNCVQLFKNETFLASLNTCKCLIALTSYLGDQIKTSLESCGFHDIPVNVINHPMEFVSNMFTIEKFVNNKDRKLVQIGAWLRRPFSIYELVLYPNPLNISKCALKGKDMDQYFPSDNFIDRLKDFLNINSTSVCDDNYDFICRDHEFDFICRDISKSHPNSVNKYNNGLYERICSQISSVHTIEKLCNNEYDELLSENIVFLDLVDCSAVNTVLEILVRNTPLIINRHPAVEEILGQDYPGFYSNLLDVVSIVGNINKITEITVYISNLDKSKFTLDHFVQNVQNCLVDQ